MNKYMIENRATGTVLGTWAASSEDVALDLMARQAGYTSYALAWDVVGGFSDNDDDIVVTRIE